MGELTKKIKCVRCHGNKIVPVEWTHRECKPCHDRTNRRRLKGKIPIEKIEQKAISEFVNFESAWARYRRFLRTCGSNGKGMSKEQFMKDYMHNQKDKIDAIKQIIAKYDDKRCPIMSHDCLNWRRLFSVRQGYVDYEEWANGLSAKDWNLFHNHLSCESCNKYAILHRDDAPIEPKFNEEGVSQQEFEKGIDGFFEAMRGQGDPVDDAIHRAYPNLKPACGNCGTQLVNGECPRGCSDISPLSNISREYDNRPQQEPQQPHDPLREQLQREFNEEKAETERLNNLPQDKLRRWLEQPEE